MEDNNRSTRAVRNWFPLSVAAASITFVITFVMRISQDQTIIDAALEAYWFLVGFCLDPLGSIERYRKKDKQKQLLVGGPYFNSYQRLIIE